MAYAAYTTQALVCGSFNRNTADRSYLLFTREAGMLYADARSVREERSRQRFSLQDFSSIRVTLVRGKAGWKVGSVESHRNYYKEATDKTARMNVVGLFRLVRRFVKGEEADAELFDYVQEALNELSKTKETNSFVLRVVEVRILALLGYVNTKTLPKFVTQASPKAIREHYSESVENELESIYTHAVSMSHL